MKKHGVPLSLLIAVMLSHAEVRAQEFWTCNSYPDTPGFEHRIAPMVPRIAAEGFARRSLAPSVCPDTGLPVETWALEGETIYSPYTGTAYVQGPTGYFGPKERDATGRIIRFGGDPLKYELAPATASLLLDNTDVVAKAFLSIPGNLSQQYHFACKNWARFYPMLAGAMGQEWRVAFHNAVANYAERRRPSDGVREYAPLSHDHTLVGQPGYLLGGNPTDGGTENHKTMWRTSALLYSQLFPDTAHISGTSVQDVQPMVRDMLRDYLQRLLKTGNGEYDSQVYYPHSIEAFMNLYDFSTDHETRQLAKFALDYYFATYGLKVIDGAIAGAQKRGYLPGADPGEMETMLWAFFDNTSRDMSDVVTTIQQATTTYRPNVVIWNIMRKEVPLPFEARMSRPFYHMDHPHAFAETFYCSESYALGSVQLTIVDNPNQQMVWSLIAKGSKGPLAFSGGHPMRGSTSGHSPYTQVLQSKGTLLLMTAPTERNADVDTTIQVDFPDRMHLWHLSANEQGKNYEARDRQRYAAKELRLIDPPVPGSVDDLERFWNESKMSAASWFIYPRQLTPVEAAKGLLFDAGDTYLYLRPITKDFYTVSLSDAVLQQVRNRQAASLFSRYAVVVCPGRVSGFVLESAEASAYGSPEAFATAVAERSEYKFDGKKKIEYASLAGDDITMVYNPAGLRCKATINGVQQNFDNYTDGAVYISPYIHVRDGKMMVSDGVHQYEVAFSDGVPVWTGTK